MRDFFAGIRYLGRGQKWVLQHGRWFGFGLLPALVTLLIYGVVMTALALWTGDIATWATPFADSWATGWQTALRVVFMVLLWIAVLALAALAFTALTLAVGEPFYERLSEQVERDEGGCPASERGSLWRELLESIGGSLYVLWRAALWAVLLFALGFVPVVGQSVVPALGFCVSGFFLALELTSVGLQRRGMGVRQRLALLRTRRLLAVGFGLPLVLLYLLPLVAVVLMPGAVAGATLLVRDLAGADEAAAAADEESGETALKTRD